MRLYVNVTAGPSGTLVEQHGPFTSEGFAYQFMTGRAPALGEGHCFVVQGLPQEKQTKRRSSTRDQEVSGG